MLVWAYLGYFKYLPTTASGGGEGEGSRDFQIFTLIVVRFTEVALIEVHCNVLCKQVFGGICFRLHSVFQFSALTHLNAAIMQDETSS